MNFILILLGPIILVSLYGFFRKQRVSAIILSVAVTVGPSIFYGIRHLGSWFGGADIGFGLILLFSPILTIPLGFMSYFFAHQWGERRRYLTSAVLMSIWISLSFAYNESIRQAELEYKKKSEIDCAVLPYHCAVQKKDFSNIESYKKNGFSIESRDGFGHTALIRAINEKMSVQVLLENGADPNSLSGDGMSPLFYSLIISAEPNFEVANLLIKNGARVNELFYIYGDSKKMNVLNFAITQVKVSVINFLISNGADPSIRDDYGYNACDRLKIYKKNIESIDLNFKCF